MSDADAVLLDTHAWIWLHTGSAELSASVVDRIEHAGMNNGVFLSAISVWEVATLAAKGRISLTRPIGQWVEESVSKPGMNLIPLTPEISVESTQLPQMETTPFHGDPADRIIVASARITGKTLITRDQKIITYGAEGFVAVERC